MIHKLRHPFLRHFRLVGSAFLLHHVLANQWVVVIILLVFSTKENMFVEHTENMMMYMFWSFMLWPEVIIPKIATLSKGLNQDHHASSFASPATPVHHATIIFAYTSGCHHCMM